MKKINRQSKIVTGCVVYFLIFVVNLVILALAVFGAVKLIKWAWAG
jgi:large-conductance mechanosensitive channel